MGKPLSETERLFHLEMIGIYEAAKKLKPPYYASLFLRMVNERGGKATADALLAMNAPSDGFTELFLRGKRLDLSVEYVVLKNPWRGLFEPSQLATARERLQKHGFAPPTDDATGG